MLNLPNVSGACARAAQVGMIAFLMGADLARATFVNQPYRTPYPSGSLAALAFAVAGVCFIGYALSLLHLMLSERGDGVNRRKVYKVYYAALAGGVFLIFVSCMVAVYV